jgi:uncharacterized membrane protein YjgN (DUF898 family)
MDATVQPIEGAQPEANRALPFSFTGSASEYFGIWIVNLLLSIVTLGIYTAWAKVRRLRYFYGNSWLDGHNFEYHARPVQILIGRLIVFGALIAVNILVNVVSPLFGLLFIPYLLAFPWLINKSIAFNARMTSYRNVRLNFRGTYWGAFVAFIVAPLLGMFSLGFAVPVASHISSNYIGQHLGYGTARFETDAPIGTLYRNLGMTILFMIGSMFVVVGAFTGIGFYIASFNTIGHTGSNQELAKALEAAPVFISVIGGYVALGITVLFYLAGVRNVAFNATTLEGGHHFASNVGRIRYTWILISNLFATILTIGLLRPWASIRTWRYLANRTTLHAAGTLEGFVDTAAPQGNVAAAEFFDIEGIDFGL